VFESVEIAGGERMNEIGYTKSWRKKYKSKFAERGLLYFGAVDWLVGMAAWKDDADSNEVRGEIATTLPELSELWKMSTMAVRTVLKNLVDDEFIHLSTRRGKGGKTVIKIINYDTYQVNSEKPKSPQKTVSATVSATVKTTVSEDSSNRFKQATCGNNEKDNQQFQQQLKQQFQQQFGLTIPNKEEVKEDIRNTPYNPPVVPYPNSTAEVIQQAMVFGFVMTEERAQDFLDHYKSKGWMNGNSQIRDWRYLLSRWRKDNANIGGRFSKNGFDNKRVASAKEFGEGTTEINF
jgi:hypothetical protein